MDAEANPTESDTLHDISDNDLLEEPELKAENHVGDKETKIDKVYADDGGERERGLCNDFEKNLELNGENLVDDKDGDDGDEKENSSYFSRSVERIENVVHGFISKHNRRIKIGFYMLMLNTYLVYFAYCMSYRFGDEGSIILLAITIALAWKLLFLFLDSRKIVVELPTLFHSFIGSSRGRRLRKLVRFLAYVMAVVVVAIYLGVRVFPHSMKNLQSLVGMFLFIIISFIISPKPSKVKWHPVFWSFIIQFGVATFTLRTEIGYSIFKRLGDEVQNIFGHSDAGSRFVIDKNFEKMGLAFSTSGVLIFTCALIFLLNHWGVIEFIIIKLGGFLSFCLETGPVESVVAAANIFLSLTDAPIFVKPYLHEVTKSELHTIMTCGFASVSGSLMAIFIRIGAPANHLLTASVISAPAALAISKLMYPETEKVSIESQRNLKTMNNNFEEVKNRFMARSSNLNENLVIGKSSHSVKNTNSLSAFSEGAMMALSIVAAVMVNLLAFVSMLDLLDSLVGWFGARAGVDALTFEVICSYVFSPVAYAMGVDPVDCKKVASLIGIKLFATPFISYQRLGLLIQNRKVFEDYTAFSVDNSWHWRGDDIFLEASNITLTDGTLSERSEVIATYAMCGLSAFAAIGITLGGLIPICPSRQQDIVNLVFRAFIAGNVACFATGAIAGVLF